MTTDGRALGGEHWEWLQTLLAKIYIDAFEHGYKHGYDDALEAVK
jgi:hypothetical protein